MDVQILTPAGSRALLTLVAVKERLGISGSSKDIQLQELIDAVSAASEEFFGCPLVYQQYRVRMPGSGRDRLILPTKRLDRDVVTVEVDDEELDDFSVDDALHGYLYRELGWPRHCARPGMDGKLAYVVDAWAGCVPPTKLKTWSAALAVAVGDWIAPTNAATTPLYFRVAVGGTTGGTEPTWPTVPGAFDEGLIDYVGAQIDRVPADILRGAMFAVTTWFKGEASPAHTGVRRQRMGPHETEYFAPGDMSLEALPRPTVSLWEAHLL